MAGADAGFCSTTMGRKIEGRCSENDVIEQSGASSSSASFAAQDRTGCEEAAPVSARKIRRESGCGIR